MQEQLKLDNQLCFRFYTVSRLITQAYRPMLDRLGLTYPQYLVMMVLWEKNHQPVNDIAKRLMLGTNTLTPLLKRMEADGVVIREKGQDDARQVIVSLTRKGQEMEADAMCVPENMARNFACSTVDPEKVLQLYPVLDALIAKLSQ